MKVAAVLALAALFLLTGCASDRTDNDAAYWGRAAKVVGGKLHKPERVR